ncbi:MAG: hypothetical protein ACMUIU_12585 [bacterium]
MKKSILNLSAVCFFAVILVSCAGLKTDISSPMRSSINNNKRIVVFPFEDPLYKGNRINNIGGPFATIFINKLQSAGISAELVQSNDFSSSNKIDLKKACNYAANNGYDMFITGTVTEWIDGATQWSGTVDVAALSVDVYNTLNCELSGSVSGKQNGQWFTFVNAPTTRFFEPLSEEIITTMLNQGVYRK